MTGYESLKASVLADIEKESRGCKQFHPEGCPSKGECFHNYCDKFSWTIDRAKHYGEKTGEQWENILDAWEKDRDYWYMNYYQESNQPIISNIDRIFDNLKEVKKSIGSSFICPNCKQIVNDPRSCSSCEWSAGGFLGTMCNGATFYVKETKLRYEIFWPVAWGKKKVNP